MAERKNSVGTLIVSREQVNLVIRKTMTHPLLFGIFIYAAFAETIFGIRVPIADLPFMLHLAINSGIAGMNMFILYAFLGTLVHAGVGRNIPMIAIIFSFVLFIGVIEMSMLSLFMNGGVVLANLLNCLFQLSVISGFAEILALGYFKAMLTNRLAVDPDNFPLFFPVRRSKSVLQARLPRDKRGAVLRVEALGQYVAIYTDMGRTEVRLPLKDAIAELPKNAGTQVHRSHWVRHDQIDAVVYQNGNPRLRLVTEEVLPLGRKMVEPIKNILDASAE